MDKQLAVFALFSGACFAACAGSPNCTVKAAGGGNYTTIQACATAAVAGDTCTVYAGTYAERVFLTTSGTTSASITLQVNPGDLVQVQQFYISGSYVTVNGFYITEPTLSIGTAGVYMPSVTGVQILNNTITQVGFTSPGQLSGGYPCIAMSEGPSHFVTVKGNTLSWCSSLSSQTNVPGGNATIATGINAWGDHLLIDGNDISHAANGISLGTSSTQLVMRGNTFHDSYIGSIDGPATPPQHDALGCIETNSCDTHVDYFEASGGGNSQILLENNSSSNIWGTQGGDDWFISQPSAGGTNVITRFNKSYRIGQGHMGNGTAGSAGVTYWKVYNESFIQSNQQLTNTGPGWSVCSLSGTNFAFLNNLMYNDVQPSGAASAGYYYIDVSCNPGTSSGHNIGFDSSCTAGTLAACTTGHMASDAANIYADPKLVATNGTDFRLQPGSPAIGGGTYLTTVAAADTGAGTSLIVNDAGFFQAGYGITGVQADCIAVTMVSRNVCITAVNYSTNTLTLASGITRSSGDSVWLYSDSSGTVRLSGSAPDIGALGVAAPVAVTRVASGGLFSGGVR